MPSGFMAARWPNGRWRWLGPWVLMPAEGGYKVWGRMACGVLVVGPMLRPDGTPAYPVAIERGFHGVVVDEPWV